MRRMAAPHRHRPPGCTGVFPVLLFRGKQDGLRRRLRTQEQHARRLADEALGSLNWLAGSTSSPVDAPHAAAMGPETTEMQAWVRARALEAGRVATSVFSGGEAAGAPRSDEEALQKLLRGHGRYDTAGSAAGVANNLAPFNLQLVSLPSDVKDAPLITELLDPIDAPILKDPSLMLLDEENISN